MSEDNKVAEGHYEAASKKAVRVLGQEIIDRMSAPQINLFNKSLDRIVRRHGTSDTITDLEIVGAYEMIVEHVYPDIWNNYRTGF